MVQRQGKAFSPQLPAETWHAIFRLATYVPQLFDMTLIHGHEQPCHLVNVDPSDATNSAYDTRRSIVSVSHLWRELGLEFMWESLEIHIPSKLSVESPLFKLAELFTSSGYGRWTKQIGIATADDSASSGLPRTP